MSASHTPGPWVAELGEAYNVRAPHGGIVAQIHHLKGRYGMEGRVDAQEGAANAQLIAAAPDLISALQSILAIVECGATDDPDEVAADFWAIAKTAKAAIAKAEGRHS